MSQSLKIFPLFKRAFLAILLVSISCVEPYDKAFPSNQSIYIVDGKLTNNATSNYVKITQSKPDYGSNTIYLPVTNASVKVVVNEQTEILLTETSDGYYTYPLDFKGEVGNSYKLIFQTADGLLFETNSDQMNAESNISKVYHSYNANAVKLAQKTLPGQLIYIDTEDNPTSADFYMWDWVLYEQQVYCKTCERTLYYNDASTGPLGECREERFNRNSIYDYRCSKPCWEVISSNKVNVMKDDFSNGKDIKGRLVAEIPVYQKIGALIEIRQYAINKNVYNYLKLVEAQGQNTGGLADTPPATLSGNITCISNPDQPVAGYFIVASVSKSLYWLDKNDIPSDIPDLGLLNGRTANPEPVNPADTSRPPLAPCLESDTRTSQEPEGWFTTRG